MHATPPHSRSIPEYMEIEPGRTGRLVTEVKVGTIFYAVYETPVDRSARGGDAALQENGAMEAFAPAVKTGPVVPTPSEQIDQSQNPRNDQQPQLDLLFASHNATNGSFEWIRSGDLYDALLLTLE